MANVKTNHRSRESAAKTVIRLQRSKLRATMLLPMRLRRLRRQLERLQAISNNRNKMATSVEDVVAETIIAIKEKEEKEEEGAVAVVTKTAPK